MVSNGIPVIAFQTLTSALPATGAIFLVSLAVLSAASLTAIVILFWVFAKAASSSASNLTVKWPLVLSSLSNWFWPSFNLKPKTLSLIVTVPYE